MSFSIVHYTSKDSMDCSVISCVCTYIWHITLRLPNNLLVHQSNLFSSVLYYIKKHFAYMLLWPLRTSRSKSETMATKVRLLATLIVFSSIFSLAASKSTKSNITWWCNQTPHPSTCKYFMSHSHHHFALKHRSKFRLMSVQLALEKALIAQRQVSQLGQNCEHQHQRVVWADCLKLHSNTILQLNRTLIGIRKKRLRCTDVDAQTWLSTALTNIQTCRTGSLDLNVSDFTMPAMSRNLSELISNTLAINGVLLEDNNTAQEFPSWFSRRNRRLLQSASITAMANLVVAKDGSGKFRSIQAAINAASKRRYKTRLIIHVKRGVYKENIEVGANNNNIWLVGDGMRNTIITSSRSVGGGYTTYSSATAGKKINLSIFETSIIIAIFASLLIGYMLICQYRISYQIYLRRRLISYWIWDE